ncbi:retrovirus-related pol polyprotein from transposon TNT 1-94 [Tanacetum coccineum]
MWESTLNNKNTNPLDYSWISKMEKLDNENVSLEFQVQSLIKERDNVKLEYQKLFDSIKKTRSQSKKEMDELIEHVSEKTYAYGAIRAENQNLLSTISELKTRLETVEKGKSVNTKFDMTNVSQNLLCVTPLNKQVFQKKTVVSKTKEKHVVSKPVTLQTSPDKQRGANSNKNVIVPGMYRVVTTQESQTNEAKSDLSSTGMNAASSVRRPMNRDSHVKNNVLANFKNLAKKVAVYVRKNKKQIIHLQMLSQTKRITLSTNSRTPKSLDTTYVVLKTRFSKKLTQSKSLDTTSVVSKPKIDVGSASKAKNKVFSASKTKKQNLRDKPLSIYMKNRIQIRQIWQKWFESQPNFVWSPVNTTPNVHNSHSSEKPSGSVKKWVVKLPTCPCVGSSCIAGTVRFGNDNFAAITGYGDYIQGNITICHVYYVEGDDLLIGGRESNLYTISISDMSTSSPVCLMSKSTSTKSWLWHRRLSHLNFDTINNLTRLDLVDGLPKFKYGNDHLCPACERGKSKKASHPPKLVPMDDYSRYTWVYFLHSKDKTPEIIKKFIAEAQLNYKAKVCKIRTDNGTEFKNEILKAHYEKLGIMQQFLTARTP